MSGHTLGWRLIWHGNEEYPYPFDVEIEGGTSWIARDGTVSDKAHALLMVAAPDLRGALRIVSRLLPTKVANGTHAHIHLTSQDVETIRAAIAKADGRTPR